MRTRSLLLLSSLALAAAAHAQYSIRTYDAPGVGATFLLDINDSGQWAGYTQTPNGFGSDDFTAITGNDQSSTVTTLSRPGTIGLGASGINSSGAISGVSVAFDGMGIQANGFSRSAGGAYTDIDPSTGGLPSAYSEAVDLNDNGMVAGFFNETVPSDESGRESHGFYLKNGAYTQLDYPGAGNHGTQLYSVNNSGMVSGRYLDVDEVSHGFLYDTTANSYLDIDIPGFDSTEGDGLNNLGDYTAVGYVPSALSPTGYLPVSFVHTGGAYVPFAIPGAAATIAYGLNDQGQVVGTYITADAMFNLSFHGFVATPVPEPTSFAVLGLGAVALLRRRRA